jgi:Protein of unknown function (DUF2510)
MWTRILLQPWWVRGLAVAGVCAIAAAVSWCASWLAGGAQWPRLSAFAGQVAGIIIFGLVVAALTGNSHRAYTYALAGLDPAQRSAAVDASVGGAVPVDAPVRDAAIRITERRLRLARFWRVMWLIGVGMGVLSLVIWIFRSELSWWNQTPAWHPGDWINFAISLGFAVGAWYASISAKHRLQMLRQTSATGPAPGWYPDPSDSSVVRYFDGRVWTLSTRLPG